MQALSTDHVLIQVAESSPGRITAEVVGLNDVKATAASKDEAIAEIKQLLKEKLRTGELISVPLHDEHPALKWFGHAKDDPDKDAYLEEIRRYRKEMDSQNMQDTEATSN
jgi:hypothetical protein